MEYTNLIGDSWTTMPFPNTLIPSNYAVQSAQPLETQIDNSQSGLIIVIIGVVLILAVIFFLMRKRS